MKGKTLSERAIELTGISKSYGAQMVLEDINLTIDPGEFVVFVGPSGCGKSTLLRMIAGLEEITGGNLQINGRNMNTVHPSKREVAMVFQSYALYPHMTVGQNIGFSMRLAKVGKAEINEKVMQVAKVLQLDQLLDRKPSELSGGQRQRVAIGRAIVRDPQVFLFDEPLSNLDAALRVHMRLELERLHKKLSATMVYVTHDQVEAMTLADKIVVLNGGGIQQAGSPIELYTRPCNRFVANFIGSPSMNFLAAELGDGGQVVIAGQTVATLPVLANAVLGDVMLGVRPEHLRLNGEGEFTIEGTLSQSELLGAETLLYITAADGTLMTVREPGISRVRPGDKLKLSADLQDLFLFENGDGADQGRALIDYDAR
ncbi:ABC transporter ATP-binding protein [Parasedimentitalea psychrophila]|uniref:ABC transporter ATP-binding protein n=1 Tax=Parasedimentitalea psychrophila TaxID=2997337 RepID=A0A9Y2KX50_9RHOB|nr:ABC transporter ATP-binding protein [Parasedimentitalea psychrophila]WIY24761.1 ABC transporter ATP-binding protein [Parasedimentitalea psychrophila]